VFFSALIRLLKLLQTLFIDFRKKAPALLIDCFSTSFGEQAAACILPLFIF